MKTILSVMVLLLGISCQLTSLEPDCHESLQSIQNRQQWTLACVKVASKVRECEEHSRAFMVTECGVPKLRVWRENFWEDYMSAETRFFFFSEVCRCVRRLCEGRDSSTLSGRNQND